MMTEIIKWTIPVLGMMSLGIFLYKVIDSNYEERKKQERNKDFDFTEFNKTHFGDL